MIEAIPTPYEEEYPEEAQMVMDSIAQGKGRALFAEPSWTSAKVGRNEPCPCDSGKKYKKCCGKG